MESHKEQSGNQIATKACNIITALIEVPIVTNLDRNVSYVPSRSLSAWQCLTLCKDPAFSRAHNGLQHYGLYS